MHDIIITNTQYNIVRLYTYANDNLPLLTSIALEHFLMDGSVVFMTNSLYSTQTLKLPLFNCTMEQDVKDAISVARSVMEHTEETLLVGDDGRYVHIDMSSKLLLLLSIVNYMFNYPLSLQ